MFSCCIHLGKYIWGLGHWDRMMSWRNCESTPLCNACDNLKIISPKFHSNLPDVNEFRHYATYCSYVDIVLLHILLWRPMHRNKPNVTYFRSMDSLLNLPIHTLCRVPHFHFSLFLFQHEYGDEASQEAVAKLMPDKVKRRRKVQTEDGVCHLVWLIFQSFPSPSHTESFGGTIIMYLHFISVQWLSARLR